MNHAIEPMEARRLLSVVRPDLAWGRRGELPDDGEIIGVQPNGATIISTSIQTDDGRFFTPITRLSPRGRADATFATIDGEESGYVDAAGRVVTYGVVDPNDEGTVSDDAVYHFRRFLPDGTPDASFGTGGRLELPAGVRIAGLIVATQGIAAAPDGGLYFDGFDAERNVSVRHVRANGTLDTAFAGDGTIALPGVMPADSADLAVDSEGRLLLTGQTSAGRATIARFTPAGRPDTGFATRGVYTQPRPVDAVTPEYGDTGEAFDGLAVDRHDRPIAILTYSTTDTYAQRVLRLTAAGAADPAWTPYPAYREGFNIDVYAVAADSHDRVWVGGTEIYRLETDGTLDPGTVNDGGSRVFPFGDADALFTDGGKFDVRPPAQVVGDTLTLTGTNHADVLGISSDAAAGTITAVINGVSYAYDAAAVAHLSVELFDGDDRLTSTADFAGATVTGGAGDDTIATAAGVDDISGGPGDDRITTGIGTDSIDLGGGNNAADVGELGTIRGANTGRNVITVRGGSGFFVQFIDSTDAQTVTVLGGDGQISTGSGDDRIDATAAASGMIIKARDGSNVVTGGAGDDTITAGTGRDTIDGGAGNDDVFSANASTLNAGLPDRIDGGDGDDTIVTGGGDDTITAGVGDDTVGSQGGDDRIDLGSGRDSVDGEAGDDTILGGDGDDSIRGSTGADQLDGGFGRDTLRGGPDDDSVYGGGGRDRLYANSGHDTLAGGNSADTLVAGSGPSVLIGNAGNDLLVSRTEPDPDIFGNVTSPVTDALDGGRGDDRGRVDDDDVVVSVETLLPEIV